MPQVTRNPKLLHYTMKKQISPIQQKLKLIEDIDISIELFKQAKNVTSEGNVDEVTNILNEYQTAEDGIVSILDSSISSLKSFVNKNLVNPNIAPDQGGDEVSPTVETLKVTDKPLSDIYIHSDNTIYIATKSKGFAKGIEPITNDFQFFSIESNVSPTINCFLQYQDYLFIGTNNGLIRYNLVNNTFDIKSINEGLISNTILSLAILQDGALIIGTNKGLSISRTNGLTFGSYDTFQTLINTTITTLFSLPAHNLIYIGTEKGVYHKDITLDINPIFESSDINNKLTSLYIYDFGYTPGNDTFYIGTDTGLLCVTSYSTTPIYTMKNGYNGLGSNTCYSIVTDDIRLFVGTNNGISYTNDSGTTFKFIVKTDGLQGYTSIKLRTKRAPDTGVIETLRVIHAIGLTYSFDVQSL